MHQLMLVKTEAQSGAAGFDTGNGEKLSSSQTQPGR